MSAENISSNNNVNTIDSILNHNYDDLIHDTTNMSNEELILQHAYKKALKKWKKSLLKLVTSTQIEFALANTYYTNSQITADALNRVQQDLNITSNKLRTMIEAQNNLVQYRQNKKGD